jgi:hypothetical protein
MPKMTLKALVLGSFFVLPSIFMSQFRCPFMLELTPIKEGIGQTKESWVIARDS